MRRSSRLLLLTSVVTSLGAVPVAALDEGRHRLRVVAVGRGGGRGADVKHFHRFGGRCFSG